VDACRTSSSRGVSWPSVRRSALHRKSGQDDTGRDAIHEPELGEPEVTEGEHEEPGERPAEESCDSDEDSDEDHALTLLAPTVTVQVREGDGALGSQDEPRDESGLEVGDDLLHDCDRTLASW
jgi:hypothetical protein